MAIVFEPIGIIRSPFRSLEGMPIQPTSEASRPGEIEIFPPFVEGLEDLDGFSHLYLIYYFHLASAPRLRIAPFLDSRPRGIFATRAPCRPNPIGLSLVRLLRVDAPRLYVERLDVLDGTPLLDIKPYVPPFEAAEDVRVGWLAEAAEHIRTARSDARFGRLSTSAEDPANV